MQASPVSQAWPQPPQWFSSVAVETHPAPLQNTFPSAQVSPLGVLSVHPRTPAITQRHANPSKQALQIIFSPEIPID
jgi:hypothetical protein